MSGFYYNPVRIFSGINSLDYLKNVIPDGKILLIISKGSASRGLPEKISELIQHFNITIFDQVSSNPELADIEDAIIKLRSTKYSGIIALGGGSVIDFAKVLSIMLIHSEEYRLIDILRNSKQVKWRQRITLIAIPTTSGTGSEVTPFATVWDTITYRKYSFTDNLVYPAIAFLDPALTCTLPVEVTLNTALDSISHALESLWNKNRNLITESMAVVSLQLSTKYLTKVLKEPSNIAYRGKLQIASLFAGISISQTRTAVAHSISYPLTMKLGIPHGLACSFTLSELINIYLARKSETKELTALLFKTQHLLLKLDLGSKIKSFASSDQIIQLSNEMYSQERADNFVFQCNDIFILRLITLSLNK